MAKISNSNAASGLMCIIKQRENPDPPANGIYLGKTAGYGIPFLLDHQSLVNPHTAILGMTGSGKTYLLKSLITNSQLYFDAKIIVFDWNGEYHEIVDDFNGNEHLFQKNIVTDGHDFEIRRDKSRIISFNLSNLQSNDEKGKMVRLILERILEQLPRYKIDGKIKCFIVIDEAWKIFGGKEVGSLFREARKYGFGMIIATQMASDISNEIISNSACLVIFKLQNSRDFSILQESEVITKDDIEKISALKVGSCLVIERHKSATSQVSKTVIERVYGASHRRRLLLFGGGMDIEIGMERFVKETVAICGDSAATNKLLSFVEHSSYKVDLLVLIEKLIGLKLNRAEIVTFLRALGVDDFVIVNVYNEASGVVVE